jgi:hypothetical protein
MKLYRLIASSVLDAGCLLIDELDTGEALRAKRAGIGTSSGLSLRS